MITIHSVVVVVDHSVEVADLAAVVGLVGEEASVVSSSPHK